MRSILTSISLILMCALLCGCPYYSPYPLETEPTEQIQESWLGTWKRTGNPGSEKTYVTLSRSNDKEYGIAVSGSLKAFTSLTLKDSIKATGYASTVDKLHFLNVFYNSRWYIVQVVEKDNKLSFLPLAEHFTTKIVTNSSALKTAVSYHFKHRQLAAYDDIKLEEMQR